MNHGAARIWLNQVYVLMQKELKQLVKDRALFAFTIFIFTLDIMIAAGAASVDLHRSPLAVHDLDRSTESRALVDRFQAPYFEYRGEVRDAAAGLALLDLGQARALLSLPPDFAERLQRGQPVELQLLVDTAQATQGFLFSSYTERIVGEYSAQWSERALQRAGADPRRLPEIRAETRFWYNAALEEAWFNTVSEMLGMITVATILLPAAAMVREKERGTIEQLLVAPVSPWQVVLSKILAMVLVMLAGTAVAVLGVMNGLYGVPFRGSHVLFFFAVAVFAITSSGLGIVAASFARNSGQVGLIVMLIVVPTIMLSGTWNMTESMPSWLQMLVEFLPLRHFIILAYGILIRGAELAVLWPALLKMALLGCVLLLVGVLRFKRQFR